MKFPDMLRTAFLNLWRRKLRAFLTVLGMVIGTSSIVVMVSLGVGMRQSMIDSYASMGSLTNITVNNYRYVETPGGGGGTFKDVKLDNKAVDKIRKLPGVEGAMPQITAWGMAMSGKYATDVSIMGIDMEQAAKKAGRIAAEGAVVAYMTPCGCTGALVEVNCETDFVANTDNFKNFANAVAKHVALAKPADLDELMKQKFVDDASKTIEDMVSDATVAIGEKITVRRFARYETEGVVSSYIHMGGKVGVMVEVATDEVGKNSDLVKEFAHDVCLQIAAAKPEAVRREEVDADKLAKEAEIQRAKAIESGKPEKIVDRIVAGQIEKYYKEVCLLDQQFVKDGDKTITSLMNETAKAAGTTLDIVRYVRFERGEGIEKRKDDLAAEIAAMKKA